METQECDALLEKLYDQMEREMQVNLSTNYFFPLFCKRSGAVPEMLPIIRKSFTKPKAFCQKNA